MRKIICAFHYEDDPVEATSKCQQCGAPLCLEHTFKMKSGSYSRSRYGGVLYEYCPECYDQAQEFAQQQFNQVVNMQNNMMGMMKWFMVLPIIIFAAVIAIFIFGINSSPF